jgi:putative spermidine/putrescine transport system permease protein
VEIDLIDRSMDLCGRIVRIAVYSMLALPALIVLIASFDPASALSFPPKGFSLKWYSAAFSSEPFMSALWTSTHLAVLATILAMMLGFFAALAIDRYTFPGRSTFQMFVLSPLIVPSVILGLGLLQFLAWAGLNQSYIGLLSGHVLITLPYVVRTLTTALKLFDKTLEEAAMNLRASPVKVLWRVTLPLLMPSLISASVFAFVTSFGNVTLSVFLGYSGATTLPVQVMTYVENSSDPVIAAVSSIVIAITFLVVLVIDRLVGSERVV